jgi:hypothetical protein
MKNIALFKNILGNFDKQKKLSKYLSQVEIDKLNKVYPFIRSDIKNINENILDLVHYSWFIPILNIYSQNEASMFLLALSPNKKRALLNLLDLKDLKDSIGPIFKSFLRKSLYRSLVKRDDLLLPMCSLYDSRLNVLLDLTKDKLVKLIEFLGIYDLKKELKFIIEKKNLKKINSYLKLDEKEFLKQILHQKSYFPTQRIYIENFLHDKKKFRNILHKCGLIRLSLALSGESIDLIWYLCHTLDIGRGNYIFKECKNKKVKTMSEIITDEILEILNIIK